MISHYTARAATNATFELGEGILWDDRSCLVRWVDIQEGRVLSGVLEDTGIKAVDGANLGQSTGAVALAEDGGLLVAAARGLATISSTGSVSLGPDLLGLREQVRLNDGAVDPYGAFVVGSLSLAGGGGQEVLLRIWPNGDTECLRDGVGLSNGIAFSPDGATIFHVDTIAGTVSKHPYDNGQFDRERPWTTVLQGLPGKPDGLVIDSDGAMWVALWGAGKVNRYSVAGELLAVVSVPAKQPSCPAFVGPGMDSLAITTARLGLRGAAPLDGAVFLCEVGIVGLPSNRWSGSTIEPYWETIETKGNTS